MSKKILSLALVVVMLMSMFAFSTNAAELTTGQIGIRVESDAHVGMQKGEIVTVKVYYEIPDDFDVSSDFLTSGNISLAYNNTKYLPNTTNKLNANSALTWGASYAAVFNPKATVSWNAANSNKIVALFNTADKAQGWNAALQVQLSWLSGGDYAAATGFPVDPDCEIFSFEFVVQDTLTAADTIGTPAGAYGQSYFQVKKYIDAANTAGELYPAENVILTDAVAVPAAPALEKVTGKIRVNGSAVDLGYIGTSDMAVTVKAVYDATGKTICRYDVDSAACGIAGVGIEAKVDGVAQSSTATKIYLNGSITEGVDSETVQGGFKFLPALTGVDASALTSKIEIRTYVLKTDGSYEYSAWVELDAQTTYDDAVAAGMADIFA